MLGGLRGLRGLRGLHGVGCFVLLFAMGTSGTSACTKSHDVMPVGLSLEDDDGAAGSAADDGSAGTNNAGTAGRRSPGGTAGGAAGSGGGAAGTGLTPGAGCDNCEPASVGGVINLPACCAQASGGGMTCGLDVSSLGMGACVERDGPGVPDSTCPSVDQQIVTLPGCCRPNGKCGSLDTFVGLGCTPQAGGVDQDCGAPQ
jgi:hypothetical protein